MEMVNGYPCRDCADVAKAKRGIDPVGPAPAARLATEPSRPEPPPFRPDPSRLLDLQA